MNSTLLYTLFIVPTRNINSCGKLLLKATSGGSYICNLHELKTNYKRDLTVEDPPIVHVLLRYCMVVPVVFVIAQVVRKGSRHMYFPVPPCIARSW